VAKAGARLGFSIHIPALQEFGIATQIVGMKMTRTVGTIARAQRREWEAGFGFGYLLDLTVLSRS